MSMGQSAAVAQPGPADGSPRADPATAYHPLMLVLVAAALGIAADRDAWPLVPRSVELLWLTAAVSLGIWFLAWRRARSTTAMIALGIAVAATGAAWHHLRWNRYDADELGRFAREVSQPVGIEAVVASEPRRAAPLPPDPMAVNLPPPTRLWVEVTAIRDGADWRAASGRAQLSVDGKLPELHSGDRLRIFGQLAAIAPALNPGEFDFARHARADRQLCSIRADSSAAVTIVARGSPWSLRRWIENLRARGQSALLGHLSDDHGLAAGLLLGYREQVDRESSDAFLKTGTIHILSISGLHVAILAWVLFMALRTGWMSRRMALAWVVAISGVYMLLSGAEPPVVRATVLVWITCGALWLGRPGLALNSLALAALVALAINPADLFRIGVQLSFLSAGILMWMAPKVARWPARDPLQRLIDSSRPWPSRALRGLALAAARVFVMGAVIWAVITPLTMARFHLVSPIGLVLNVVLAPLVTAAMISGFCLLALGWVPLLGTALGWCCETSLAAVQGMVDVTARLPGAYFWVPGPSEVWVVAFYVAIAALLVLPAAARRFRVPRRWRVALVGGCCGVGLITMLPQSSRDGALRCTFVSVGHGCGVVVELPDGKTLLYDAGRQGSPLAAARSLSASLWSRGISRLDAVVVSHGDVDHYNAIPELVERFSVGVVYAAPQMFQDESRGVAALRAAIDRAQLPIRHLSAGDRLHVEQQQATIEVLHPPPEGVEGSDNANSIVLRIDCAGRRILLTGDLESPGLEALTSGPPLDCDVVLAPHHGSARSDPPGFAAWSTPEFVIVSGNRADNSPAVRAAYESRGAKVLHTAEQGAIAVTVSPAGIVVEPFRN